MPVLQNLQARCASRGVVVIGASMDDAVIRSGFEPFIEAIDME